MRLAALILLFALLGSAQGLAAEPAEDVGQTAVTDPRSFTQAQRLYETGRFEQSAELAVDLRTSGGLALAARALLA